MNYDATLGGVKRECARQRNIKEDALVRENLLEKLLVKSAFDNHDLTYIREYINQREETDQPIWAYCQSSVVGVFSSILTYTNKKGVSHLAHFTLNGNYLGTTKKLGDVPISYEGFFRYNPELFRVDFPEGRQLENTRVFHFIRPKTE